MNQSKRRQEREKKPNREQWKAQNKMLDLNLDRQYLKVKCLNDHTGIILAQGTISPKYFPNQYYCLNSCHLLCITHIITRVVFKNQINHITTRLKYSNSFLVNSIKSRRFSSAYKALREVAHSYLCDCISCSSSSLQLRALILAIASPWFTRNSQNSQF